MRVHRPPKRHRSPPPPSVATSTALRRRAVPHEIPIRPFQRPFVESGCRRRRRCRCYYLSSVRPSALQCVRRIPSALRILAYVTLVFFFFLQSDTVSSASVQCFCVYVYARKSSFLRRSVSVFTALKYCFIFIIVVRRKRLFSSVNYCSGLRRLVNLAQYRSYTFDSRDSQCERRGCNRRRKTIIAFVAAKWTAHRLRPIVTAVATARRPIPSECYNKM